MVFPGLSFADTLVLKSRQGRKYVDRRLDALAVQFAGKDNLPLRDVSCQVGNRMSLVIFRHGQDRNHGNGAGLASLATRALIHGCKVGIHITRITAASRNFLAGCGDFAKRIRIVCDVRQDDKDMHIFLKCQIFRCREGHARCGNTLDGRVIGEVDEQHRPVNRPGFLKRFLEEIRFFERDAHRGKHNSKLLIRSADPGLARDLRSQLCMRQAGCGEDRKLLASDQRIQAVDGGNTGLDELGRIRAGCRIHRQAVDVHALLWQDLRSPVDRPAEAVEYAAQHVLGYAQLHRTAQEADFAVGEVDAGGCFKELYQRIGSVDFKHLAAAGLAVRQFDLTELIVGDVFNLFHQHQRAGDFFYRTIFFCHLLPVLLSRDL